MTSLFDALGPEFRAPDVSAALETLALESEQERGAVFTRPEVAAAILDLSGYTLDRALHRMRRKRPATTLNRDIDSLLPIEGSAPLGS